jgi:hypothetical protein
MKNWRTTLIGCLAAAANFAYPMYMEGKVGVATIIISMAFAAIGYLSKDAGVTGGQK